MDLNPETLASLSSCFLNSLSPHPDLRRQAESALSSAADQPNFSLAVLSLLSSSAAAPAVRHAAAVNFKNHLRSRWTSSSQTLTLTLISEPEKQQIKTQIVPVMLASDTKIRVQLSEALSVVSKHDFPQNWPTLLPDLKNSLERAAEAADYVTINGILGTINSIFKKFRYQYRSNELLLDLKYCLDGFAEPLLRMFKITARWIDEVAGSGGAAENLKVLIESQRLCCRIFFSLNFQDLPEFFEDHMGEWMGEFQKYLSLKYPSLEEGGGDGLALVDDLRAAVCENISLYLEKNEEEFIKYLSGFVESVWSLLVTVSASDGRDRLAVTGIKFLTTVSTSGHHTLFARDDILEQICKSIVIPNVMLRAEDEELFEFNHVEFIRRDMEGSDLDTRRRIACELLKGIAMNYREQVTRKVSSQIQTSLALFAENPATNWKHKDYVIYLVVSLATKRAGEVSTDLVDVDSFFRSVIVPELQNQDVNGFPMLKAGALKFFTTFRTLIPKPVALALVPDVVRLLCSESNVVHSYAASCIEKLLLVKNEGGQARYTSADIGSILPVLITNLFAAFGKSESEENQYVMKCIMRVLGVAEIATNIASECVQGLTSVLRRVCENPKTPTFNHYLFEAVAVLVRRSCERDPSLISLFEQQLFPSVQVILAQDVTEFLPYAFQLLAQLIELNRSSSIQQYIQIFYILLHPDSWTRSGNVPALVRLLQAFLQKAPQEIYQEKRLEQVLGIFEKLISSPSTVEQGFYILNTVIENLSYDAVAPYISHIWNALFTRLQSTKSVKFLKSLMIFMSLFLVKHGSQNLANTINSVHQNQPNLFGQILDHFWIPNLKLITGSLELKLAAVASTRLICESPSLLDPTASERWGKMLNSIVVLLSRTEQDRVEEEGDVPDFGENTGYGAAFVQLHNAGRKEEDPLKDIRDPKQYLVESLARLSALSPGRFPQIISANLDAANQAALLQLCSVYHFSIV